jgi:ribosomal protein S18 acetylase RimI-like enzyme
VNEPPGTTPFTIGALEPSHRGRVAEILRSTQNFRDEEVDVALELFDQSFVAEDYIALGAFWGLRTGDWGLACGDIGTGDWGLGKEASTADEASARSEASRPSPQSPVPSPQLAGFAIYGPTMATDRTYDLYWIAVDRTAQGTGCGSALLDEVERRLEALHARMLVIETSSRSDYTATRGFYLKRGYVEAARVREFYAPDDDRIILTKRLALSPREGWGAVA